VTRDEALGCLDAHLAEYPVLPSDAALRAEWFVALMREAYHTGVRAALRMRVAQDRPNK
jgi:hypothetical protein